MKGLSSGVTCIWSKTGWAPLFKWHDYLSRALFAALCSRCTSFSVQCHRLFLPRCVALLRQRPALTRVGFCMVRERGRRTRAIRLQVLKNGSIKVFPALFPTVTAGDGCAPCTMIRICIHVRSTWESPAAVACPSNILSRRKFSRELFHFYARFFISIHYRIPPRNTSLWFAPLSSPPNDGRECE